MSQSHNKTNRNETKADVGIQTRRSTRTDNIILSVSSCIALLCLVLLYDDSWIFRFTFINRSPQIGQIESLYSDVRKKSNQEYLWRKATKNDFIHQGDSLFTGGDSVAKIRLQDGDELNIDENSLITFSKTDQQTDLDLKFGTIISEIKTEKPIELKVQGRKIKITGSNSVVQLKSDGTYSELKGKVQIKSIEKTWIKKEIPATISPKLSSLLQTPISNEVSNPVVVNTTTSSTSPVAIIKELEPNNPELKPLSNLQIQKAQNGSIPKSEFNINYVFPSSYQSGQLLVYQDFEQKKLIQTISLSKEDIKKDFIKINLTQIFENQNLIKSGVYYFQLQGNTEYLKQELKKTSNIEKWNLEILSGPKLDAPILNLTKVNFKAGEIPDSLTWKNVPYASDYLIQISNQPDFKDAQTIWYKELKNRKTPANKNHVKNLSDNQSQNRFDWKQSFVGKKFVKITAKSEFGEMGKDSVVAEYFGKPQQIQIEKTSDKNIHSKSANQNPPKLNFILKWNKVPFVEQYFLQISENSDFSKNPISAKVKSNNFEFWQNNPGKYFWRVRPYLDSGIETEYSKVGEFKYTYEVPIVIPEIISPKDKNTYYFQTENEAFFWFEWKPVRQATDYQIQLSKDKKFNKIIADLKTKSTKFKVDSKYKSNPIFMRVKAIDQDRNRQSEYSDSRQSFVIFGRSPSNQKEELNVDTTSDAKQDTEATNGP